MSTSSFSQPELREYQDTVQFLTWEQFPKLLDRSISHFAHLPQTGTYQHVNSAIKPFKEALLEQSSREFTISGVGSLFDYDLYGHTIKRPSPTLAGTGCEGNSLCIEPTCFGFTEGVIENNNLLQNMCWSLAMPCLKNFYYADRMFETKIKSYFEMFFLQAPGVLQAYQRTRLIQESIKIVATDTNFRFSGGLIGGADAISLPFYIDPEDPTALPDISSISAGIGGLNLAAFANYVAPRMFQRSGFNQGGLAATKIYGLQQDYMMAKEQTASVMDNFLDREIANAVNARGATGGLDSLLGDFIPDGMFPTFENVGGQITPIPQEILEPSTIYGYVQTSNPAHNLATIRGLLFVPENWKFDLVEPPKDDFSDLGLGGGLNFRSNTPGNFPVLSSSMFSGSSMTGNKIEIGQQVGSNGRITESVKGIAPRKQAITEAVRTEVLMTYSSVTCNDATPGQNPRVGAPIVPQGRADGFNLKSTMHIGTDVKGTAKPVLLLFKVDTPRSAKPIEVCNIEEVDVSASTSYNFVDCSPGNQIYVVLTATTGTDLTDDYTVADSISYRTGNRGNTFLTDVTVVSGNVMTLQATNGTDILPCCAGGDDDYGVRSVAINNTTATATSSEIIKSSYDEGSTSTFIELLDAVVSGLIAATGTITLRDGTEIDVILKAAADAGVFVNVEAAGGETCDLENLDCACLLHAVFAYT